MSQVRYFLLIVAALMLCGTLRGAPAAVAFLGDSNTWTGGDDCAGSKAWSYHLVRNLMPLQCRSFARSGATWTNTAATGANARSYSEVLSDDNVIYNQALRLCHAADSGVFPAPSLIFIAAGTNDAWFQNRRPGIWDQTPQQVFAMEITPEMPPAHATSLAASVRLTLTILAKRFPQARIIIVSPPYTVRASKSDIDRVADTLQQCAARAGVGCVRIERMCGIDPDAESANPVLTTDGTHTSPQGAWQIANCVYNYLAFNNLLD